MEASNATDTRIAGLALRQISHDDVDRLLRFHRRLSDHTTHSRFFSVHPELSEHELHYFTHVDHRDREAFVATVDDEIVGVARFDRLQDPTEAEVAFVVADTWQGRGVGSELLQRLAARGREVGLTRFVAETLPDNYRMIAVFQHAGMPCRSEFRSGIVVVSVELGEQARTPVQ